MTNSHGLILNHTTESGDDNLSETELAKNISCGETECTTVLITDVSVRGTHRFYIIVNRTCNSVERLPCVFYMNKRFLKSTMLKMICYYL